jgi:hypothetical protein
MMRETQARLDKEETIWAPAGGCWGPGLRNTAWRARSTPERKNVYKRKATSAEQLRGELPVTQFGRT